MIGWMSTAGRLFSAALIGDYMITGDKGVLNLFLNMADNVVSAVIVSSRIVEKGRLDGGALEHKSYCELSLIANPWRRFVALGNYEGKIPRCP
jgi:hypothetical protein